MEVIIALIAVNSNCGINSLCQWSRSGRQGIWMDRIWVWICRHNRATIHHNSSICIQHGCIMRAIVIRTRCHLSHCQTVRMNKWILFDKFPTKTNWRFVHCTAHRRQSASRPHSRAASPALSTKSRKSTISARGGGHRHSYVEQQELTDDESSESASSYLDDYRSYRRDSGVRSSRHSVKASPQPSLDDDSDRFSRRSLRERRAASSARSVSSRTGEHRSKTHRLRSDSTQDSETEIGTRALVQAKIREKVAAQQSSLDESSSDFWKPKSTADKETKRKSKANGVKKVAAKARESKQEVAATPVEKKNDEIDEGGAHVPDGPPPKTPSFEWECEFCTFTNEANTKICAICCKTPTTVPIKKTTANGTANETPTEEPATSVTAAVAPAVTAEPLKGRTKKISRKITFWPGTKSK